MSGLQFLIFKYLLTAAIVVLVSELAKHSGRLGALVAALPTVTILTLIWLHVEHQPRETIASHAWYTLWYVIPTLPMFLLFPFIYGPLGFWSALGLSGLLTLCCFAVLILAMRPFGVELI